MKNKIIISIALILLTSSVAFAKVYKCTSGGKTIYQSGSCPEKTDKKASYSSAFDGWQFGVHIPAMKQKARKRQLAISPGSYTYINKYNEKLLNSKPEERKYTYKTRLMEKLTSVTLFFTNTTEELYKIEVTFHVVQLKTEERKYFYESLFTQLSSKYGEAENIDTEMTKKNTRSNPVGSFLTRGLTDSLVGTLQAWGLKTDNVVTLSYKKNYHTMNTYKLTYKNVPLMHQNDKEITYSIKQRTNQAVLKDGSKL